MSKTPTPQPVQFSHSVVSDSLWPHGLQYARPPCPSPTPGACSNSCPLSRWCRPTVSSSVVPFFSSLQSFPASGSFQMSQLFTSGGQSIGVSASTSVLPMNILVWSPLGWTGWISLQSKGLKSLLQHRSSKASILWCSAFFIVQLSHPYMTTGKRPVPHPMAKMLSGLWSVPPRWRTLGLWGWVTSVLLYILMPQMVPEQSTLYLFVAWINKVLYGKHEGECDMGVSTLWFLIKGTWTQRRVIRHSPVKWLCPFVSDHAAGTGPEGGSWGGELLLSSLS